MWANICFSRMKKKVHLGYYLESILLNITKKHITIDLKRGCLMSNVDSYLLFLNDKKSTFRILSRKCSFDEQCSQCEFIFDFQNEFTLSNIYY